MKTVLLHVRDDTGQKARLQAALDVVRASDGHLVCLQATPFDSYIVGDPFGGVYAFPEVIERVRETERAERTRIEADLGNEGVSWEWLHFDGSAAQMLVEQGRLADLIVVSRPPTRRGANEPLPIAADVALYGRAPVLVVPEETTSLDCAGTAVIAWNGSAEAANALRLSVPMLKEAGAVHIVTVDSADGSDLPSTAACRYLSRHGIHAELHETTRRNNSASEAIVGVAEMLGAAYLVMGAYGRSRLSEMVLGGTTRAMLQRTVIPVLIAH